MRSKQMMKRDYNDGKMIYKRETWYTKDVPTYYLVHNIPDEWDEENFDESYSIIARYPDGNISQWFYSKDDLKSAFRVFRIMSNGRNM